MQDITRKKDTGEPGNGGEFGSARRESSGLRLEHQGAARDAEHPGLEDLDRKWDSTRQARAREYRNLAEALGFSATTSDRAVIDHARDYLAERTLKPARAQQVQLLVDRIDELSWELTRLESVMSLTEQARELRARRAALDADLATVEASLRRWSGLPA